MSTIEFVVTAFSVRTSQRRQWARALVALVLGITVLMSGAGATAVVDVIIMLGTNDSKSYNWMVGAGTRAQQFVTGCTAMVDHFASLPTHPLVYLALPPRAFTNTYGIDGTISLPIPSLP